MVDWGVSVGGRRYKGRMWVKDGKNRVKVRVERKGMRGVRGKMGGWIVGRRGVRGWGGGWGEGMVMGG